MIRARQPFYPFFKNTTTPICTLPVVLLPCQFHGHLLYRYLSKPFFPTFFFFCFKDRIVLNVVKFLRFFFFISAFLLIFVEKLAHRGNPRCQTVPIRNFRRDFEKPRTFLAVGVQDAAAPLFLSFVKLRKKKFVEF